MVAHPAATLAREFDIPQGGGRLYLTTNRPLPPPGHERPLARRPEWIRLRSKLGARRPSHNHPAGWDCGAHTPRAGWRAGGSDLLVHPDGLLEVVVGFRRLALALLEQRGGDRIELALHHVLGAQL